MKTILLIRHAKSSWNDFSMKDAERPLNDRGRKNAPEMAKRLLKRKISIDAYLSSPAVRALTTAELFAKEMNGGDIIIVPELYMADNGAFTKTILSAPPHAGVIAIFSHNSGITSFANTLTNVKIDDMPTCSVFTVNCDIEDWEQFEAGNNRFDFFDYPKALKQPNES